MLNLHAKSQRHYFKTLWNAKFEVLTEVLLKIQSFRDVTLHHWINSPKNFKGSCVVLDCLVLKMKALQSFNTVETTRSVRKVSDLFFLCEHLMDYNLARLHEPTLNLSAHA